MRDWEKILKENDDNAFQMNKLFAIDVMDIYKGVYANYKHYRELNFRRKFVVDEELFNYIQRRAFNEYK